jgi:glycosyltransferase involved in cell wall biosynthesis
MHYPCHAAGSSGKEMSRADGKTVLMICYHYPPANNGGVERSVKFAKYLPDFGWNPLVVTTNKFGTSPVPKSVRVVYAGELRSQIYRRLVEPSRLKAKSEEMSAASSGRRNLLTGLRRSVAAWIDKWLLIPDDQVRWVIFAFWPSLRALLREEASVIFTTSPPASAHLMGLLLKKVTGKAWLMDMRDPWTLEPLSKYLEKAGFRRRTEEYLERICFMYADSIVLNTREAEMVYKTRYPENADKMTTITNGFDAEEIRRATLSADLPTPWSEIKRGEFVISHVGSFSRRTDKDTTPYAFLEALKGFLSDTSEEISVRVIFAGALSPESITRISELGLNGTIETIGLISHFDALRLVGQSDLLVVHDPNSRGKTYVQGKIYEYMGAGKPILGLLPEGASRSLLEEYGRVVLATSHDLMEIKRALEISVLKRETPERNGEFDLASYERRQLTRLLACRLDSIECRTGGISELIHHVLRLKG